MATLIELEKASKVFKFDASLAPSQQEFREIYVFPKLRSWFENDLAKLESTWKIEETPIEQVDALTEIFCAGETLAFGWQFKPINHIRDGIWELKTADVRIFGWFVRKDCFIGTAADSKDRILERDLYAGYRDEAARFRSRLDLNEPKFVKGDDPNDVVSNFCYP